MTVCTLFGDRDTPEDMREKIKTALTIMIRDFNVDFFYIGNEGNFDELAEDALYELCTKYPYVGYNLAMCIPEGTEFSPLEIYERNLCPFFRCKGSSKEILLEKINRWMIQESDYVIIHTKDPDSEVSKLRKYARRKNKRIILLCC